MLVCGCAHDSLQGGAVVMELGWSHFDEGEVLEARVLRNVTAG